MKRSVAIILMAALCIGGFFGVNALKQETPAPDVGMEILGVPGDTTVATVNGTDISLREFGYWVTYVSDNVSYYYFNGGPLDWDMEQDGFTLREAVLAEAELSAKLFALVESKVTELGLLPDAELQAGVEAAVEQTRQQLGGEAGLKNWLALNGLSYEEFEVQSAVPFYYDALAAELCGDEPATTAEVEQYISDNDLLRAKHILFMTVDPATGEALDEETLAEKKALAESVLAELEASSELEADFDRLMQEHSEDAGLALKPDGYTFSAGEMVKEFEETTRALEYGRMSGIVETSYGYHIILRLDPASEKIAATVAQQRKAEEFNRIVSGWLAEEELVTTELYDSFDPQVYYDGMLAVRSKVQAALLEK